MSVSDPSTLAHAPLVASVARFACSDILTALSKKRCVVIRGPHEVGKSQVAASVSTGFGERTILDASLEGDRILLTSSDGPVHRSSGKLVIVEDYDFAPEIVDHIRVVLDAPGIAGHVGSFLLVASRRRRHGCTATDRLGTRVEPIDLAPINLTELIAALEPPVSDTTASSISPPLDSTERVVVAPRPLPLTHHWLRGGFPLSILAPDNQVSFAYRRRYIDALCDRDYAFIDGTFMSSTVRNLILRVAHLHGSVMHDRLTRSEKVLVHHFADLGILRLLQPWS